MICITCWSGFGLGWGKPVMVNPANFRHPRRDMVIVAGVAWTVKSESEVAPAGVAVIYQMLASR